MTTSSVGWKQRVCNESNVSALAKELNIEPVIARLLVLRGLVTPEEASKFLHPSLDQLYDPFLLTDLRRVTDRLFKAIKRREKIAVHGDYDVDGVTSTVILRRMIELLGGDVFHFIPDRFRDGYGLQPDTIDQLKSKNVSLVVSVDCGISSQQAAERAKEVGIDLVITDHHEPKQTLPPAFAVVNPRRRDCLYPNKDLAGVGVALKLVHALCLNAGQMKWLPGFLKMAAIGTVADIVPLKGENRIIARLGLEQLTCGPNTVGLQALLNASGLSGKKIGSYEVGFVLAPRVNAAGRMSTPDLATKLLLAVDKSQEEEAKSLAEQLDAENTRRRREERAVFLKAINLIKANPNINTHNALVVWGENWHRGVIGIVASKLVEQFSKPAIVLSVLGDVAYGSARSFADFNLLTGLESCAELFDRFGGHKYAAGLSMQTSRLDELRRRFTEHANNFLNPDDLFNRLSIDAKLPFSSINRDLVGALEKLEPFGLGNPRPVFQANGVEIVDGPHKIKDHHLRMTLRQGRSKFRGVAWKAANRKDFICDRRDAIDLAFSLSENTYYGQSHIELSIADVK